MTISANISDVRDFAERLRADIIMLRTSNCGGFSTVSKTEVQALVDKMASSGRDRNLDFILHLTVEKTLDLGHVTLVVVLVSTNGSRLIFRLFINGGITVTFVSSSNLSVEIL